MEKDYELLGVKKGCSKRDMDKALKQIRTYYHPDKHMNAPEVIKTNNRYIVENAEKTYERIQRELVKKTPLDTNSINPFQQNVMRDFFRFPGFQMNTHNINAYNAHNIHTTSYSCTHWNNNGTVHHQEKAYINGKEVDPAKLRK